MPATKQCKVKGHVGHAFSILNSFWILKSSNHYSISYK
jgi:hypothetical protein